eukprot:TRINITY_DN5615_c0_g1_i1.p1 TRINITY_DN5615_c0_g1~~TRINITY_DN5615_c0_g1_i1.p1  ORF type:complete len:136 (+),score=46.69 TRINITY_DN5615_c0_g1_i1:49-456(+)
MVLTSGIMRTYDYTFPASDLGQSFFDLESSMLSNAVENERNFARIQSKDSRNKENIDPSSFSSPIRRDYSHNNSIGRERSPLGLLYPQDQSPNPTYSRRNNNSVHSFTSPFVTRDPKTPSPSAKKSNSSPIRYFR